jgi:hypothetical protein
MVWALTQRAYITYPVACKTKAGKSVSLRPPEASPLESDAPHSVTEGIAAPGNGLYHRSWYEQNKAGGLSSRRHFGSAAFSSHPPAAPRTPVGIMAQAVARESGVLYLSRFNQGTQRRVFYNAGEAMLFADQVLAQSCHCCQKRSCKGWRCDKRGRPPA